MNKPYFWHRRLFRDYKLLAIFFPTVPKPGDTRGCIVYADTCKNAKAVELVMALNFQLHRLFLLLAFFDLPCPDNQNRFLPY